MNLTPLRTIFRSARGLALFPIVSAPLFLAAQAIAPFRSTQIHPDRTVTFNYKDAAATRVELILSGLPKPLPMERDTTGIWTTTTLTLIPEIYGYHFEADGDFRLDPANPATTINLVDIANELTVSGDSPQPWEETSPTAPSTIISTQPAQSSASRRIKAATSSTLRPATTQREKNLPGPLSPPRLERFRHWMGRCRPCQSHLRQPARRRQNETDGRRHASRLR